MPRLLSLPAIPIFLLVSATIADSTLFAIFWTASFPSAQVIVEHACEWLSGIAGRPFFLWLHLMDPHSPYYPPRQALELMGDHDLTDSRARYLNSVWNRGDIDVGRLKRHREEIIRLYDAGIHWADEQIGILVNATRRFGMWDQCVMAFTADHGEEFLEHGGRFHAPSKITEELVRVPLLIRVPGRDAASIHSTSIGKVRQSSSASADAQIRSMPVAVSDRELLESENSGTSGSWTSARGVNSYSTWRKIQARSILCLRTPKRLPAGDCLIRLGSI